MFPALCLSSTFSIMDSPCSYPNPTAWVHTHLKHSLKCCLDCVCTGSELKCKFSFASLFHSLSLPPCFPPKCLGRSFQPHGSEQKPNCRGDCRGLQVVMNLFAPWRQNAKISLKPSAFHAPDCLRGIKVLWILE